MAVKSQGPQPCDILVVGEAPGKDEDVLGVPFVGASGKELRRMLAEAGFAAGSKPPYFSDTQVRFTNVIMERPPENKLDAFCGKRAEVGKDYKLPPLSQGKYLLPRYLHHLDNLREEILATQPRLILALGNTPAWALLRRTGITALRGAVFPNVLLDGGPPVLPTFHPANILRDWSNRPIALGDMQRARRFLDDQIKISSRELWLEPTLQEIRDFLDQWVFGERPRILSFDIETFGETITCIGFAPSRDRAITIPFYDPGKPDRNYWADPVDELRAWKMVYEVLTSDIPKLGQNGLYDLQYLIRARIPVRAYLHDTMIRHHSLYPEMEKGLAFLAKLYTDEQPWKLLRDRKKDQMFKLDDE